MSKIFPNLNFPEGSGALVPQYSWSIKWVWSCRISIWRLFRSPVTSIIKDYEHKIVWIFHNNIEIIHELGGVIWIIIFVPGLNKANAFKHVNSVWSNLKLSSFVVTSFSNLASVPIFAQSSDAETIHSLMRDPGKPQKIF